MRVQSQMMVQYLWRSFLKTSDETIVLELANGKVISLNNAWFAGDGNFSTEEGELEARFEGLTADEIRS